MNWIVNHKRAGPRWSSRLSPLVETTRALSQFYLMINCNIEEKLYKQILKERFYFVRYKGIDFAYIPSRLVILLIKAGIRYDFNFNNQRFILK